MFVMVSCSKGQLIWLTKQHNRVCFSISHFKKSFPFPCYRLSFPKQASIETHNTTKLISNYPCVFQNKKEVQLKLHDAFMSYLLEGNYVSMGKFIFFEAEPFNQHNITCDQLISEYQIGINFLQELLHVAQLIFLNIDQVL